MALINFRKETSERSDEENWAKKLLVESTEYHFESIEGCNQNSKNQVTHLIERARVDYDSNTKAKLEEIKSSIIALEGLETLIRKIAFANYFSIPLSYALYCNENENVYIFEFQSINKFKFIEHYNSYSHFSSWIAEIKGWKSKKIFREIQDLPYFDKALRKSGTPWPTNIDSFICDKSNNPVAILEFQNAKTTQVLKHCNNDFFLCKISRENQWGNTIYHDDIRRWISQEILRVQSNLRFFIITWAQNEKDFILKEIDVVTIPYFPKKDGRIDWDYVNKYKALMHQYIAANKSENFRKIISSSYSTYNLVKEDNGTKTIVNKPTLSINDKTFPSLYYRKKQMVTNNPKSLTKEFNDILKM